MAETDVIPRSPAGTAHRLLALLTISVIATGCGGGSGGRTEATQPPPAASTTSDLVPYWATGTEVRANLRHLATPGSGATVIALGAAERQEMAGVAFSSPQEVATAAAVQRRTVTGLSTIIWHKSTGSTQTPLNLTAATIEAYAPDGLGGFELIPATAKRADGTYTIANVPEGPHWVRRGTTYIWTDTGFVDWSLDQFGRDDVQFATLPTRLSVDAGNLVAWQGGDTLHWVTPMQGSSFALPLATATAITNPPVAGDTALAAFGLNLFEPDYLSGLLDAAKGDQAYLNQLSTQPATGVRTLARSAVLPALTLADGSTTPVATGFLDITPNAQLRLRWNRSAFAALASSVHPSAVATNTALAISAFALPPSLGLPFDAYTLAEYDTFGTADLDFGRLRYGSPFPADWNRVVDSFVGFTVRYLAPGATVAAPLLRGLSSTELLDPATRDNTSLTLSPRITPPRSPQINGRSLFSNQLAVGVSPTLTWQAPAVGTPSYYFVRVLELRADGNRSVIVPVARFTTGQTTMTLPPGVLQSGKTYVITIAANSSGTPVTQPFRNGLPFAFATLASGIISP